MATLRKNGKAYDSADVNVIILGTIPDEVFEVGYDTEREHQLNYSLGSKQPTSWSMGKDSFNGTLTLSAADQFKIEDAAKNAGISNVADIPPFDMVVSYINEYNLARVDRVTCKFMNNGRSIGGDQSLRFQYKLFILAIKFNS